MNSGPCIANTRLQAIMTGCVGPPQAALTRLLAADGNYGSKLSGIQHEKGRLPFQCAEDTIFGLGINKGLTVLILTWISK